MTNVRTLPITSLPPSTEAVQGTDKLVAVQPFGAGLLTVQLPASKILDAATAAAEASLGPAIAQAALVFNTVGDAASSPLLQSRISGNCVAVYGYAEPGDGGAATYQRVDSEPSHAGKFQDVAGEWWELRVPLARPEMFGARGDGVTNDTVAMQAGLDYLSEGDVLLLRDGATYLVDNLTQPQRTRRGIGIKSLGMATIKSSGLGNSNYLIGSNSYVNNLAFSNWPLNMENIIVDGDNSKDIGLALATVNSRIINCRFTNCNVHGLYLTETTIDGVTNCPSVVDNAFIQCVFDRNAGSGFSTSDLVADYQIFGGNSYFNDGYGLNLATCAGFQMTAFTTYANGMGNRLAQYGFGTSIVGCTFDDSTEIATLDGTNQKCQFGPGNTLKDHPLICSLVGAGTPVFLTVADCRFQGAGAHLLQNFNAATRTIFLNGGTSDADNPVKWNFTSPTGIVIASNHWSAGANGFLNGRLRPLPNTFVGATACNTPTAVMKNLSAGTTTDVVIALSLPASQYSGSSLRVKLSVLTAQNAFADVETYTGYVDAAYYRRQGSAIAGSHAAVRDEASSAGSGISAAAAWGAVGGAGDQVATLTITVTHAVPSTVSITLLRAEVEADHRFTTAMVVT